MNYTIYEFLRKNITKYIKEKYNRGLNALEFFLLGLLSKLIATVISYPI